MLVGELMLPMLSLKKGNHLLQELLISNCVVLQHILQNDSGIDALKYAVDGWKMNIKLSQHWHAANL